MLIVAKRPPFRIFLISTVVLICSIIIGLLLYTDLYFLLVRKPVGKFGCDFVSEAYRLKRSDPAGEWLDDLFNQPVWGEEREPLVLSSEDELEGLIGDIDEINGEVLQTLPYNSIDNFIQFYAAYNDSGLDFRSFYAAYEPTFRPAENCIGLAIYSLDRIHSRLASKWPQLAEHTYLVSSRNVTSLEWITDEWETVEEEDGFYQMMGGREMRHVLGALKVEVNGRQGFILIDQGYGVVNPIVLMLDEQAPHNDIHPEYDYNDTNTYELVNGDRYILWNVILRDASPDDEPGESHRIYVHRPYCSFLYNTEKRDLLRDIRSIIKRTRLGKVNYGLYFNVRPNARTLVKLLGKSGDGDDQLETSIPLEHLSKTALEKNKTSVQQLQKINRLNDLFGYKPGVLLEKLQQVEAIMQDDDFIDGCTRVTEEEKEILDEIFLEYKN